MSLLAPTAEIIREHGRKGCRFPVPCRYSIACPSTGVLWTKMRKQQKVNSASSAPGFGCQHLEMLRFLGIWAGRRYWQWTCSEVTHHPSYPTPKKWAINSQSLSITGVPAWWRAPNYQTHGRMEISTRNLHLDLETLQEICAKKEHRSKTGAPLQHSDGCASLLGLKGQERTNAKGILMHSHPSWSDLETCQSH